MTGAPKADARARVVDPFVWLRARWLRFGGTMVMVAGLAAFGGAASLTSVLGRCSVGATAHGALAFLGGSVVAMACVLVAALTCTAWWWICRSQTRRYREIRRVVSQCIEVHAWLVSAELGMYRQGRRVWLSLRIVLRTGEDIHVAATLYGRKLADLPTLAAGQSITLWAAANASVIATDTGVFVGSP